MISNGFHEFPPQKRKQIPVLQDMHEKCDLESKTRGFEDLPNSSLATPSTDAGFRGAPERAMEHGAPSGMVAAPPILRRPAACKRPAAAVVRKPQKAKRTDFPEDLEDRASLGCAKCRQGRFGCTLCRTREGLTAYEAENDGRIMYRWSD